MTQYPSMTKRGCLLMQSDFISLLTPLTYKARCMIDNRAIRTINLTAIIINAARGSIIYERALADAHCEKRFGDASLDVFEEEPVGVAPGAVFAGILNLVRTPHIAGAADDWNFRNSRVTIEKVVEALKNNS